MQAEDDIELETMDMDLSLTDKEGETLDSSLCTYHVTGEEVMIHLNA
jgi:hypothetical protein